jgi:hypothetical protein
MVVTATSAMKQVGIRPEMGIVLLVKIAVDKE